MTRMLMVGSVVSGALVLSLGAQLVSTQGPQTAEALLGAAIHQDDAEGNLEAAIEGYRTFLAQYGDNRPAVVFHLFPLTILWTLGELWGYWCRDPRGALEDLSDAERNRQRCVDAAREPIRKPF